jgi:exopolysaccharide biosynthesis polyprenyl glycosylphosphotransferase
MTKRHLMTLRLLLLLGDGVAAWLTFMAVSTLRFDLGGPSAVWSVGLAVETAAILFAATWSAVLWSLGMYRLRLRWSLLAEARDLVRATLVVLALTLSALFLFHQDDVSRVFLALLFVVQPAVSLVARGALRQWFEMLRRRGLNPTYMLVVGSGPFAQEFADRVEGRRGLGLQVVGHLAVPVPHRRSTDGPASPLVDYGQSELTRPVLGRIEDLDRIFKEMTIDEVAVVLPPGAEHYLDPVISLAADVGKTVRIPVDPGEEILSNAISEEFEGLLVRSIIHDGHRDLELAGKRLLDIIGATIGLLIFSPLLLITALLIRLREGSPVLFRQTRVGKHGRAFTIYKFRTMVPDADERYEDVAEFSDTGGAAFKMRSDPRVTPIGAFLRRSSIDELPQLLNVLRGEMSLVGPRPAPPREVDRYDMWHRRRLSMRPGMTGLWQVRARLDDHFDERAELDLHYIDQWSLLLDLGILARTVPAILARQGH